MNIEFSSNFIDASQFQYFESIKTNGSNDTPESSFSFVLQDVLSEGPIEGLCDENGNVINYLTTSVNTNSNLGYGIRYNNLSIKDKKTKKFNSLAGNYVVDLGNEYRKYNRNSTTVYEYRQKIYDYGSNLQEVSSNTRFLNESLDNLSSQTQLLERRRIKGVSFSHKVRNKYANRFKIFISVDQLNGQGGEGIESASMRFAIGALNSSQRTVSYLHSEFRLLAKGSPFILYYEIGLEEIDRIINPNPEITIYIFSTGAFVSASNQVTRSFSVDSIVECVDHPFSYPYIASVTNLVDSKFSSSIPNRAYDCKLLKIKVPDNYDAEIREYVGDWSGNFSKTLKWTDDPAWIFYDLCVNSRYGIARGELTENDLDKWNLYSVSKFCNSLVKTNVDTRYSPQEFTFLQDYDKKSNNYNCITISTSDSLETLLQKYPIGSILYLYDTKNSLNEKINTNFKKIIFSVEKIDSSTAKIRLINNFGVRKFIESDSTGRFVKNYRDRALSTDSSVLGMQDHVQKFAFDYLQNKNKTAYDSSSEAVSIKYIEALTFDSSFDLKTGFCVAKHDGYAEFLEPRFSSNFIINSETEALKVITDLASVFRGIFYFKNGLLSVNTDVEKNISYMFSNSNVKYGIFNYVSASLDGVYSTAKVSFVNKDNDFKDEISYVEDSELISKYGIIEREIIGYGITSRSQAYRLGKWFLTTNKLESDIVNFSTGLETYFLNPGDIIRIVDNLKTEKVSYGKITSLDLANNYIYIDREVPENSIGKKIRITVFETEEAKEKVFFISEVDNKNLKLKIQTKPFLSWNVVRNIVVDSQNYLSKLSASGNAWNSKAYSDQSYVKNCQLSWSNVYTSDFDMVGLSSQVSSADQEYSNINYAIYSNGTTLQVYENGVNVTIPATTVSTEDVLRITFENGYIRYYKNSELIREVARLSSEPLYAIVAFYNSFAAAKNINFESLDSYEEGSISELRAQLNFAIYLEEEIEKTDLYRIVSIAESSANEYAISAMRYSQEKYSVVELDEYVDKTQDIKKQIVFSNDDYVYTVFTDSEISSFGENFVKVNSSNISTILSTNYDYEFPIEEEYLTESFDQSLYREVQLNFSYIFQQNKIKNNVLISGLLCKITSKGKSLQFRVPVNQSSTIKILIGFDNRIKNSFTSDFDINLYAYDINGRLFNV